MSNESQKEKSAASHDHGMSNERQKEKPAASQLSSPRM